MKKLLFLIASVLTIGTACITAGCQGNQGGSDTSKEQPRAVEQQDGETPEEDNDCKDGKCEKKRPHEDMPEFRFRPHKARPNKNHPTPKPMPIKPKN